MLDFKLNWKSHIHKIKTKISQACGVLYQLRNKITIEIAKIIYSTLILPYFNSCNVIWASCAKSHLQPLIATQNKIARIMTKSRRTVPTSPLFLRLKILKLCDIINLNTALFVFKSVSGLISSPIQFEQRLVGPYNLRNVNTLVVPFSPSSQSQRFIHVRGTKLWNSLPLNVRSVRTVITFKYHLKTIYLF